MSQIIASLVLSQDLSMDILLNVVLPLSLVVIMLSLGIGLTGADFRRVAERPAVFAVGICCQLVLIPLVAFGVVKLFGLSGAMAAGVMLLSFCPGGVTSNVVSRLAGGDVALSVSLTACVSLLSILTVPLPVGWTVAHFMADQATEFSLASLGLAMFLITALPVACGMAVRAARPAFADRVEPGLLKLASALFAIIVLAAIAANWQVLVDNAATLAPALVALNLATMLGGFGIAALLGFGWRIRKTISIEVGLQNSTLGITLAPIIMGVAGGLPTMAVPSAVYGVVMYITAFPFVLWLRHQTRRAG